jgi:hypothetical protein
VLLGRHLLLSQSLAPVLGLRDGAIFKEAHGACSLMKIYEFLTISI